MPYKIEIRNDLDVDYCDKWVNLFARRKSKSKKREKNCNSNSIISSTKNGNEKCRSRRPGHQRRCLEFYLRSPFSVSGLGLRTVKIRREGGNGFGFTLRHFIVYPPELYTISKDEERPNRSVLVKVTEPVDTIFVKSIVQHGPADRSGLAVGDRIVSVNGRTIFGNSYDTVVQLIQKTPSVLCLEVSPKQYDTLQLFYEETAYRPETNQRPYHNQHQPNHSSSSSLLKSKTSLPDPFLQAYHHHQESDLYYFPSYDTYGHLEGGSQKRTSRSGRGGGEGGGGGMSSSSSSHQHHHHSSSSNSQFISHLPRPTPYKSSSVSEAQTTQGKSSSRARSKAHSPQAYYPFNQDPQQVSQSHPPEPSQLCKIREEVSAKSAENILVSSSSSRGQQNVGQSQSHYHHHDHHQRSTSEEGLRQPVATSHHRHPMRPSSGTTRYASYDETCRPELSSHRRESTGSIPSNPDLHHHHHHGMVVTMSSTNSKMQQQQAQLPSAELSDSGSSLGGGYYSSGGDGGYEHKMADRIRRSCEQKEEFLRRPNQPFVWAPTSSAPTPFPKELYATPQKFEKIPWPPQHIVPTVSSSGVPPPIQIQGACLRGNNKPPGNVTVVSVEHYQHHHPDYHHHQRSLDIDEASKAAASEPYQPRSLSPSWLEYVPRNRTMIIGSRKLHCDTPLDWNPDLESLMRTEEEEESKHDGGGLSPPSDGAGGGEVKLRKRNEDLDETERLVRRVSYLKATSSPIDMDNRKSGSSPISPTLSGGMIGKATSPLGDVVVSRRRSIANKLSAEFFPKGRILRLRAFFEDRNPHHHQPVSIFKFTLDSPCSESRGGFGNLLGVRTPDNSEVQIQGQIHYKIRLGESKKGGYNRSWRLGWAQIRRNGCLYIFSKEPLSRESVNVTDEAVILALSLRTGVSVEQPEDYSKRKHVLRVKTSYSSVDITNINENTFGNNTPSLSTTTTNTNAHPPSHSTPVEILIQADDGSDYMVWLQGLLAQLENNNYCNGGGASSSSSLKGIYFGPDFCPKPNSKSSRLTSFLPSPAGTSSQMTCEKSSISTNTATTTTSSLQVPATPGDTTSPKNKTWKGKMARGWKKVHNIIETGGDAKGGSSPYSSLPPAGVTFGISLESCPPGDVNPLIPRIIEFAIDVVERKGIDMVGLYRIPGNNATVATLTERLNKGEDPNPDKDPRWMEVHVVASLIKSFLRRLPDPLLTDERYPAFILAADETDVDICHQKMQFHVSDLPDSNYETLRAVVMHLKNVAEHGDSNRMDARNLAIVFGPTIVRTAEENVTSMVQDMKNQCKIVELLISNADEFFKERRCKDESKTPSQMISSSMESYNINDALRLPTATAVQFFTATTENQEGGPPPPHSPSPTIESELRASLFQAARRKVSQTQSPNPQSTSTTTAHNVHGLPTKPNRKGKPIDDAGFIRSYAGLNEETEQRVKKFELETRAMLSREDRSPHSSLVNVGGKCISGLKIMNLDDALQRAKDDMENEDIYDQLADNPSCIVHHRDRGLGMYSSSVGSGGTRNLSSSSLSSSNSNGTNIPPPLTTTTLVHSSSSTAPQQQIKLGPTPFKSLQSSLPPKPPHLLHHHSVGGGGPTSVQSRSSFSSSSSPISPLRRVSSMDRFVDKILESSHSHSRAIPPPSSNNKFVSVPPIVPTPKHHHFGGSLDSLKDIAQSHSQHQSEGGGTNTSRNSRRCEIFYEDVSPRSSEGSDLVTSLSKTLDKKLESLRFSSSNNENDSSASDRNNEEKTVERKERSVLAQQTSTTPKRESNGNLRRKRHTNPNPAEEDDEGISTSSSNGNAKFGGSVKSVQKKENGIKKNWRRRSMIERRVNGELCNGNGGLTVKECTDKSYYRDPSLYRLSGDFVTLPSVGTTTTAGPMVLSKEAKTATNKLTRDCRRRHSLSGGGEILSLVYPEKSMSYFDAPDVGLLLQDPTTKPLSSAPPIPSPGAAITSRTGILESHV